MNCPCDKKPQGGNKCGKNTPPVLQINSEECPVLFHTVNIPASVGTVETLPPTPGAYKNARVTYEADNVSYLYDSDGIPQLLSNGGGGSGAVSSVNGQTGDVVLDAEDVGAATPTDINGLQTQIDALTVASDVTDVVGTYAELEAYDTSTLKDNDIIKVLTDETHDGAIYYYRWSTSTEAFAAIGSEGPYYTKAESDALLNDKQDTLTAGANITISSNTISATDTTYTAGTNVTIGADNVISATDTTYSNFIGTDGTDAGSAGLVPAPATTDAGKFLKADGTWDAAGGTLYTTYGQNTDGAMTQKATTDLVYTGGDPKKINIGDNGVTGGTNSIIIGSEDSGSISSSSDNVIIGHNATTGSAENVLIGHGVSATSNSGLGYGSVVAIGLNAQGTRNETVAIGKDAKAQGQEGIAIGASATNTANYGSAIGYRSSAASESVAFGHSAQATGQYSTAIGYNTTASASTSVALGENAQATGQYGLCIGRGTANTYGICIGGEGTYSSPTANGGSYGQAIKIGASGTAQYKAIAIGLGSNATTDNSYGNVAIGDNSVVDTKSSVALGSFAKPRAQGVVDVGISSNSASAYDTAGYNSTRYRLISGVHDGEQLHDVATVAQGNTLATSAPTTTTEGVLGQLYTDTTSMHTYQLTAIDDVTDPDNPLYTWTQRW